MSTDAMGARERRKPQLTPATHELIARATADPDSDETAFLAQLRAIVAAVETPADRRFASYCSRPVRSAHHYARRD